MEKLSRWYRGSYIASSSTVLSLLISCINVGHLLQLMSQYWHVIIKKCTVPFFCYIVLWVLTNVEYLISTVIVSWLPWQRSQGRISLPMRRCKRRGFDPWVRKDPLEKEMATHSGVLAWKTPWTEEPGGL